MHSPPGTERVYSCQFGEKFCLNRECQAEIGVCVKTAVVLLEMGGQCWGTESGFVAPINGLSLQLGIHWLSWFAAAQRGRSPER